MSGNISCSLHSFHSPPFLCAQVLASPPSTLLHIHVREGRLTRGKNQLFVMVTWERTHTFSYVMKDEFERSEADPSRQPSPESRRRRGSLELRAPTCCVWSLWVRGAWRVPRPFCSCLEVDTCPSPPEDACRPCLCPSRDRRGEHPSA